MPVGAKAPPLEPLDATEENPFHPFVDRVAFEWANYHFKELQTSEAGINKGLDLWLAAIMESGDEQLPWKSAKEMYQTIDSIQQGSAPWKTIPFRYSGPLPAGTPPKWMTDTYELCTQDIQVVLAEQLSCSEFNGHFDYVPYRQFNGKGDRVWSNLMSATWADKQAVWPFSTV